MEISPRVAAPDRVGQGTAVEQSRAIAEVEAQAVMAKRFPRNESAAITAMRETCRRRELAERAFFRYPKAGKPVSGPSIQLARELARIWGNISYGSAELRRDDEYGQSEMLAYAWDVQTNAINRATIINPHKQYTGGGDLTELRDIQENNASVINRRVREAIWAVLPSWFVEEAKDLCAKTIADGGGIPLPQRIANAIEVFGNLGVTIPQLEMKIGLPSAKWTDHDVAQLRIIRASLLRGEISKDEEFPAERTSAADVLASAQQATPAVDAASPKGEPAANGTAAPADPPMRREPTTVPPADDGTDPAENEGPRNQGPRPVRPAEFGKLLAGIPLGPIDHVHDFLSWKAGRKVTNLKDLTDADMSGIAQYLTEALDAVGNDPAEAASAIWADFATESQNEAGQEPAE
jgi:hypothetical protein